MRRDHRNSADAELRFDPDYAIIDIDDFPGQQVQLCRQAVADLIDTGPELIGEVNVECDIDGHAHNHAEQWNAQGEIELLVGH